MDASVNISIIKMILKEYVRYFRAELATRDKKIAELEARVEQLEKRWKVRF